MTCIDGARLLADRIGAIPAEPVYVPADASALFHWCGVNPDLAPTGTDRDASTGMDPTGKQSTIASSPARMLRLSSIATRRA